VSITIITAPTVYLIGGQDLDMNRLCEFMQDNGVGGYQPDAPSAGEQLVEVGGRLCYLSFRNPRPGGNAAYIEHILEVGHGSVLEHAVFTVILTGISRSLSHELVRHRAGLSPSQLSQRYVDSSDVSFVLPPAIPHVVASRPYQVWLEVCRVAQDSYEVLTADLLRDALRQRIAHMDLEDGLDGATPATLANLARRIDRESGTVLLKQAREAARSVLPNCTETKVFLTGNVRAWRWLIELRGTMQADAEFRRLAVALLGTLKPAAPHLFADMTILTTPDGIGEVACRHHKV
jgi:thymidylate synthase (FAD)